MKNPLLNLWNVARTWLAWRRTPGVFRAPDAALQLGRVLLPARFAQRAAARALARQARIERQADGAYQVSVLTSPPLAFFWPTPPDPNLWFLIEQELTERNPHHYTSPPVQTSADTLVLDVGACEGLFAFRCLRWNLARAVIAFEPAPAMADLLRRGAEVNGVADRLRLEPLAVTSRTGTVHFDPTLGADAGCVVGDHPVGRPVPCTTLDDYGRAAGLKLTPHDLIKIDAEGADWEVLRGAEALIRDAAPQIAVTTYHCDEHASRMVAWLKEIQPGYRLRLKGFAFWTPRPRPVLLQASTLPP